MELFSILFLIIFWFLMQGVASKHCFMIVVIVVLFSDIFYVLATLKCHILTDPTRNLLPSLADLVLFFYYFSITDDLLCKELPLLK